MRVNLFLDRGTALESLNPRVKVALLAGAFASAYAIEDPVLLAPILAAEALLFAAARATANVRRLAPMFVLVPVTTFTLWAFFYREGEALFPFGPSAEGLRFAAGMAMKLEIFLAASILFLSTTRVEEFTDALRSFGMPYRMSFAVALAFRLVPLFLASAMTVVAAQRARGLDFGKGGVTERLGRYVPIIVPVFMGALRRADAMAMALEARGFTSRHPRTTYVRSRFGRRDAVVTALVAVFAALYVGLAVAGYGRVR